MNSQIDNITLKFVIVGHVAKHLEVVFLESLASS